MVVKKIYLLFTVFLLGGSNVFSQQYPFPRHTEYFGHIKPGQFTQAQLDNHVRSFYDAWKKRFLVNGCESNQYYVFFDSENTVTVSEAIGYGMMIVPIMAGYDKNAKIYFDGLYRYYKAHPSHVMPHLMAWKQITGCVDADGPNSASDGDIDIAFGLLLAHAQWGSAGEINYLGEALAIIHDIKGENAMRGDVNQELHTVKLGDWVSSGNYMNGTRTSDFITDHFRVFRCATQDSAWSLVVDKCYDLIAHMQTYYSAETGLIPDFIDKINTDPMPADPYYLEGALDGNYSYNACRDPWRLATDYLINGDERAKEAVLKMDNWLFKASGGNVNNVYAGYYLDGTEAVDWSDIAFIAPFAVGAMLDTLHQSWLNALYDKILSSDINSGGYYDNTLKLLSMITLSGNYWVPDCNILNAVVKPVPQNNTVHIYPSHTTGTVTLEFNARQTGDVTVEVFDGSGTRLLTKKMSSTQHILDLGRLSGGVYLIRVTSESGVPLGVQKVVRL